MDGRQRRAVVRLAAVGLGAGLAGAGGVLGPPMPPPAQPAEPAAIPVTVAPVTRQDVPIFAEGIGTVQAFQSVLIQARVTGWLDRIAFSEGQDVKPGDLLAEIDP